MVVKIRKFVGRKSITINMEGQISKTPRSYIFLLRNARNDEKIAKLCDARSHIENVQNTLIRPGYWLQNF